MAAFSREERIRESYVKEGYKKGCIYGLKQALSIIKSKIEKEEIEKIIKLKESQK